MVYNSLRSWRWFGKEGCMDMVGFAAVSSFIVVLIHSKSSTSQDLSGDSPFILHWTSARDPVVMRPVGSNPLMLFAA